MPLVHASKCTRNDVTEFTPYKLMFCRKARLAVDLAYKLPINKDQKVTHSQDVESLKKRLEESYKQDLKITFSELEHGDRVLVRNVQLRGKHKLADKWEADIHVEVKHASDLQVYTVKPEDLLLLCSFLPASTADTSEPEPIHRPKTRHTVTESNEHEESIELDTELLIQWVVDSTCEEITRFTTVHEYPKPSQESDITNFPDCDFSETAINEEPDVKVKVNFDELTDHILVKNIPDEGKTGTDKLVDNETVNILDGSPEDSVTEPRNQPVNSPDEMDSDDPITIQPVRQSKRIRHPSKRDDYPDLGNPPVTVVKSLFQGLSTVFSESLNCKDRQYWLHMQ
ncbi:splicing factor, arginine/serine-rich 2 [Sarotherodon galilaeus]